MPTVKKHYTNQVYNVLKYSIYGMEIVRAKIKPLGSTIVTFGFS